MSSDAAIYLAGHGSLSKPRLIELQYRRIVRYREALENRLEKSHQVPTVFVDFRLPRFGMGKIDLNDVPSFQKLYDAVQNHQFNLVFIDLDDSRERLTPDYETAFVRELLEEAGAKVLNAFNDDQGAFKRALNERCGPHARDYEVTESSDFVCFFPSLASEVVACALRRELQDLDDGELRQIKDRIEALKRLRPYSGGGHPFIEERLSGEWQTSANIKAMFKK